MTRIPWTVQLQGSPDIAQPLRKPVYVLSTCQCRPPCGPPTRPCLANQPPQRLGPWRQPATWPPAGSSTHTVVKAMNIEHAKAAVPVSYPHQRRLWTDARQRERTSKARRATGRKAGGAQEVCQSWPLMLRVKESQQSIVARVQCDHCCVV